MTPSRKPTKTISERGLIRRFAFLLSAQSVEGVGSLLFFLYIAWLDTTVYGELMYAAAAGGIASKIVEFGLYYPLVSELGRLKGEKSADLINRVTLVKMALLAVSTAAIVAFCAIRGFSLQMSWMIVLVCLGFGVETVAETFFAEWRVRGRQATEAWVKTVASASAYAYAFLAAWWLVNPFLIAMFRLVSGVIRLAWVLADHAKRRGLGRPLRPDRKNLFEPLRVASVYALIEILGVFYNRTNIFFLESVTGVTGVAFFSAANNIVEPVSILGSDQLLGWVVFPLLAVLRWKDKEEMRSLVKRAALWLACLSLPALMALSLWSELLIGVMYPGEYRDASRLLLYLMWSIPLSFESNLFGYLMMVTGASRPLLAVTAITTAANLAANAILVPAYGLTGGCLVTVITKAAQTAGVFLYCQAKFSLFRPKDFLFPALFTGTCCLILFASIEIMLVQRAALITFIFYCLTLWRVGGAFMGRLPGWTGSAGKESGSVSSSALGAAKD
jgi:O-antigen/teichoic acid export membrane protein